VIGIQTLTINGRGLSSMQISAKRALGFVVKRASAGAVLLVPDNAVVPAFS
jgi:hypothetical protein